MKKILLLLLFVSLSFNAFTKQNWFHFANDTDGQIKITMQYSFLRVGVDASKAEKSVNVQEVLVNPFDVRFMQPNISVNNIIVKSLSGKAAGVEKELLFTWTGDKAFLFRPITENGKASFEIKERSWTDTRMILDQHKAPKDPSFQ